MKLNKVTRSIVFVIALAIIAAIAVLVYYLPIIAAVVFLSLTIFLAIARGKAEGFWNGFKFFIKEVLFGW